MAWAVDVVVKEVNSATGTRTRVAQVRAEHPNQLDYSGFWLWGEAVTTRPQEQLL